MNRLWKGLLGFIAFISLLGGLITPDEPGVENWGIRLPVFFALLGFVGCMVIILLAKFLGSLFLRKGEDYYDAL